MGKNFPQEEGSNPFENKNNIDIPPGTDFNEELNNDAKRKHLDELLDEAKIDPTETIEAPPDCLQLIDADGFSTIGTLGNFSLVIGKAKSRKTFLITLQLSAITKGGIFLNRFVGNMYEPQTDALYFDTEQSKYHLQKSVKRICKLIGIDVPSNLKAYGLRKYAPKKRLEMIEHAIYSNDKVGFVVIDGIKDLVTSINDEEQASMITTKLLKWTEERNIHIVVVLHQNKGDLNARGHLGTELVNKAETVLSVTKSDEDKSISIVEAEYCRDKDPEPFAFEIEDGLPQIVENWVLRAAKRKDKVSVDDMDDNIVYQLLTESFSKESFMNYSTLVIQIKLAFKKLIKKSIGDNKAKEIITYCKNQNWLIQEKEKSPYSLGKYESVIV